MVDANETVSVTLKREFGEEALNSLELSDAKKKELEKQISNLFNSGVTVSALLGFLLLWNFDLFVVIT